MISTLLFFVLVSFNPHDQLAKDARQVAREIDTHYHRATTLKASFYERYSDGNGGLTAESGTVYFSKPGRMRWEYESPEQKLFIVDATNVWFYVPADHTASRSKVADSSDWRTPLAFFAGKMNLNRLCRSIEIVDGAVLPGVTPGNNSTGGTNTVLRCTPRDNGSDPGERVLDVLLEVDPNARLVRVVIRQAGKLETEFRFGDWEENQPIPEAKFHFVPPPGVAIVDESTLANSLR